MKLLYDFFPIVLFFLTYKAAGIYAATVVAILAALAQVAHFWWKKRRFETMHLVSLGLIVVLGGLTLILRDKAFIMWKPTLVNWAFAAAFVGTALFTQKPLIQRILGSQLALPDTIWKRLNFLWIGFFLLSGASNIIFVKYYQSAEQSLLSAAPHIEVEKIADLNCDADFSTELRPLCVTASERESLWVNFKLFGMLGLTFVFVIIQGLYLYRYLEPEESESAEDRSN